LPLTRKPSTARDGPSLYDILQVSPTASQEVIHAAYRTLARGFHPDVNSGPAAAAAMARLNAAFYVLGDHARRADYDLKLTRSQRASSGVVARIPEPAVRGKPRPNSPRRVEDQRAATIASMSVSKRPRPRLVLVVVAILVFALACSAVLWLSSQLVDDMPDASLGALVSLSQTRLPTPTTDFSSSALAFKAAQPFLNRA